MYYTTQYSSPIGTLEMVGDGENIVGLWMEGQKYFQETIKNEELKEKDLPIFSETKKWLDQYFAKKQPSIKDLPLAPKGTDFQKKVWKILTEIPYGQTMTYGDIAKQIAAMEKKNMSAQAVGGAVGHNPLSIIIPCHRVVGAHGNLTGYAGGLDKKITLLEHEGVDTKYFTRPKKGTAL